MHRVFKRPPFHSHSLALGYSFHLLPLSLGTWWRRSSRSSRLQSLTFHHTCSFEPVIGIAGDDKVSLDFAPHEALHCRLLSLYITNLRIQGMFSCRVWISSYVRIFAVFGIYLVCTDCTMLYIYEVFLHHCIYEIYLRCTQGVL